MKVTSRLRDFIGFEGSGPDFPDCEIYSLDDEQVKAIALRFGIEEFFQKPDLAPNGPTSDKPAQINPYIYNLHPTHVFLFIRWSHAPNPADNGFGFYAWPRSQFTRPQISDRILAELERMNFAVETIRYREAKPYPQS